MTPVHTSTDQLIAHIDDSIGWLTFNRPEKHNALSNELLAGLSSIVGEWEHDPSIRVLVLRGAGERSFVSGADIGELHAGAPTNALMVPTTKPVIAMIQGYCIGGGLALALEADMRLASTDSTFGIPAGRLGVAYPLDAVGRLVGVIGSAHASRLLMTAGRIDAAEAFRIGLVHEVARAEELEGRVREVAATIAENAPLTMQASKLAIASCIGSVSRDVAEVAAARCWESADFGEGRAAFEQRRTPTWSGR
jgi:enoyl-CoA hydratase